jgi:hypothetical protein
MADDLSIFAPDIPNYLVAANNHNIAAGDDSITDFGKFTAGATAGAATGVVAGTAVAGPIGGFVGAVAGALIGGETARSNGAFMADSLISGAAAFYNSGVKISNWFGNDAEEINTQDTISNYDSDFGAYYANHKQSVDLTGFLAGSLIPTIGSLKVYNYGAAALNAAKAGKIGANFSEATGLLIPTQEKYLARAISELGTSGSAFSLTNANVLKAFGAGVAEEAIQGAIASTVTLATLNASPILEDMDVQDMGWNVLSGALFQGAVGGVFRSAVNYGTIRRGVLAAEADAKPFMFNTELSEAASPIHRFLNYLDNKLGTPEVSGTNPEFKARKREELLRALDDKGRSAIREVTGKDDELGIQVFNATSQFENSEEAAYKLLGTKYLARPNTITPAEKAYNIALRNAQAGKGTPEEIELIRNTSTRYLHLTGENAGSVTDAPPVALNIADNLKPGQSIEVTTGSVAAGNKRWNFNSSPKNPWEMVGKDLDEIEARYIWANDPQGAKLSNDSVLHYTDIPLLEKAYKEGFTGIKIIGPDGAQISINGRQDFLTKITNAKSEVAARLQQASQDNIIYSDPAIVEQKLKQMLGVPFALSREGQEGHRAGAVGWTYRGGSDIQNPIKLNADFIRTGQYPLWRLAQTIKHEEGHNIWNLITDIMPGVSANKIDNPLIEAEMVAASKKARPKQWAGNTLTGYSERNRIHEIAADTFAYFSMRPQLLEKEAPNFAKQFGQFVRPVSKDMIDALLLKARKLSNIEIAKMTNVTVGRLEGTAVDTAGKDLFAMQSAAEDHTARMVDAGRWDIGKGIIPTWKQPSVAKMIVDTTPVSDLNGNVINGMAVVKQQQRLNQIAANNAVASVLGSDSYSQLPTISERQMSQATRFGPGQGFAKTANESYGSVGSLMQQVGATTHRLFKQFNDITTDALNPHLYALKSNSPAAIEWSAIQAKVRATPETYYHDYDAKELVLRRVKVNEDLVAQGLQPKAAVVLDPKADERIPISGDATNEMIDAHISRNGDRVSNTKTLQAANGYASNMDPKAFYPLPVNPKDYPFFAFVTDPTITGTGHVSMIYGATENELDSIISKIRTTTPEFEVSPKNTQLKTLTKAEVERFHKSIGDFSRDDTISENYINTALFRSGASSNFVPPTNPTRIADDILQWHLEKDRQLARYAVTTKYSKEFAELKSQGESYTNLATSKLNQASLTRYVEGQVHNPYTDYIKTALDITNLNEAPVWTAVNNFLDTKFSQVWQNVSKIWKDSSSPESADMVNKIFEGVGIKSAYYDAALSAHSNHIAPRGD